MGVTLLRLLVTSAALVVGAVMMPAVAAVAVPEPVAAVALHQVHAERDLAALTQHESRLDSVAQHVSDGGSTEVPTEMPSPPMWLLVLLLPILAGGAIGTGVTLRRLR